MTHAVLRKWIAVLPFAAAIGLYSASANAASGYVSGTWYFYNHNGNYCPTTNGCTGSRYVQSEYNVYKGIPYASVWITKTNGTMIGSGSVNSAGYFNISWTATPTPSQIQVHVWATDKDNRFFFADASGGKIHYYTSAFTPSTTSTYFSPQDVGSWYIGNSTSPDPYFNAFWAAEMQWQTVMSYSNALVSSFTGVEVRGFTDTISGFLGTCTTSCANGSLKRVQLDANAGYSPQARAMHELGHVASYQTHHWQLTNNYHYPSATTGNDGWSQSSAEWGVASFEEAWATHYGNVSFWDAYSLTPTTCLTSGTCYDGSGNPYAATNIEATSYPYSQNNCVTDEGRWPISAMRFLWDVYDSHNDADGDDYSANTQGHYAQMLNLLYQYPNGTGANQIDEPWNSTYTAVTELDGRGSVSYTNNYNTSVYNGVGILGTDNCWPP